MPVGTPNYLTTNPDGSIGAAFSGKISAAGLDFQIGEDTPSSSAIPEEIRWIRKANGYVSATAAGHTGTGGDQAFIEATDTRGNLQGVAAIIGEVIRPGGVAQARLSMVSDGGTPPTTASKILLDHNGASDYVLDSDTPPAASDLQNTYGAGLKLKSGVVGPAALDPSVAINNPVTSEIYLAALSGLVFPGLAAGIGSAFLPAGGLSTGLSATIAPSGSGRAFSFVRTFGGFVTTSGASLSWCYQTIVMGANIGIQVAVVNTTSAATASATFAPIVVVGYV